MRLIYLIIVCLVAWPKARSQDFQRQVLPILRANCIACHNATEAEGGVNLETVDSMRDSEPEDTLVPGLPEKSLLYRLASHVSDPVMPPVENDVGAVKLKPGELDLLKRWIEAGADPGKAMNRDSAIETRPLPGDLKPVFSAAVSADGGTIAASLANRIKLFGPDSGDAIDTLKLRSGDPPHADFVQAIVFSPDGRRIVSTGFRNAKVWERRPVDPIAIPKVRPEKLLGVTLDQDGRFLATLTRDGEVRVARVGKARWEWMRGFDPGADLIKAARIHLAIDPLGDAVALGWDTTILIFRVDEKSVREVRMPQPLTLLRWDADGRLVGGDSQGSIHRFVNQGESWERFSDEGLESPIVSLLRVGGSSILALGADGSIAEIRRSEDLRRIAKLPVKVVAGCFAPGGETLWVATQTGALGSFDMQTKEFSEVAVHDPAVAQDHAEAEWRLAVEERWVAGQEKLSEEASKSLTVERENLEALTKRVDEDDRSRKDAQRAIDKLAKELRIARRQLASAEATLPKDDPSEPKSAEKNEAAADREPLEKTIASRKKTVEQLTQQLDEATKNREQAYEAVRRSVDEKVRSEKRVRSLATTLAEREKDLESLQASVADLKKREQAARLARESSKAAIALAVTDRFLVAQGTGRTSLWSFDGHRLADLNSTDGARLVDARDGNLLLQDDAGNVSAVRSGASLWQHVFTIGSPSGQSPFIDRVLCADVDPSGKWFATGGGEPSRSGELLLWHLETGRVDSPVRQAPRRCGLVRSLFARLERRLPREEPIEWSNSGKSTAANASGRSKDTHTT